MKRAIILIFLSPFVALLAQQPTPQAQQHLLQSRPIYSSAAYTLYTDGVAWNDDIALVEGDSVIRSSFESRSWHRTKDLSRYPSLKCDHPLLNTLYSMSVEELDNLIEADTTWRTGKWWGGVWTRDISYSALLAAAYMQPDVTRISLMKKVVNGRIMEDTGTGGSWPVSTDCVVWTLAAWQLYLATGDSGWLSVCYPIIKNTLLLDRATVFDPETGLFKGESSFLDWREETYPRWMEPADISQSECLGTNALYFRALEIASEMALLMDDNTAEETFRTQAQQLKKAINDNLWLDDRGYYAQYLYGRGYKIASPRSETLGEALCILFGIASPQQSSRIVSSVDLSPLGTPCISPQIPNIYPYHNNAVWPFVQAFWLHASASVGNSEAVNHGIGAMLRAAALFATNQENFVVSNGDYHTAMNSPNMLWSINGMLSIVHHLFAGIRLQEQGIAFSPFIPKEWAGTYQINHFKVRDCDLDIIVEGYGDQLNTISHNGTTAQEIYLDGSLCSPQIDYSTLQGRHTIRMVMSGTMTEAGTIHLTSVQTSPETSPEVYLESTRRLAWRQVPDAHHYIILRNGEPFATQEERIINANRLDIPLPTGYTEYQVIAVDAEGRQGFASEPLPYFSQADMQVFDMAAFAKPTTYSPCWGWSGRGAVEIAAGVNDKLTLDIKVPQSGDYLLDIRYANGSGDLLGSNTCCNRTLLVNGAKAGTIVLPQRGQDLWNLWGYSNKLRVHLKKGTNRITISYDPENRNMNRDETNRAMLDQLRLIRLDNKMDQMK